MEVKQPEGEIGLGYFHPSDSPRRCAHFHLKYIQGGKGYGREIKIEEHFV